LTAWVPVRIFIAFSFLLASGLFFQPIATNPCATLVIVSNQYAWGNTEDERQRLASQGDALRPATRRLFQAAGIGPGMHVLDCGSGAGDVSIIAAELVTASGRVLGIDRDAGSVEAANRRVRGIGLSHAHFQIADISSPPDGPFDAIVGRLVLMYQPDVEPVLRALADRLDQGGVMAFMEYEHHPPNQVLMWPRSPSVDQLVAWMDATFEVLNHQAHMGTRLPSLLRSVGLEPQPPYEVTGAVYTGATVLKHETTLVQNLSPLLTAHGIASDHETDIGAFAERVGHDLGPEPVLVSGPHLAVWARKP
jgi:ubiquinone/menaquinone biosynthesis C-methylase UbiE